jgi:hydrogenase maturation protein HypF
MDRPKNKPAGTPPATSARLKVAIRGAVQGVGFRPFVYRLATELKLTGWVNNSSQGVFIEAEGPEIALRDLLLRLEREKPSRSHIQSLEPSYADPVGYAGFEVRESAEGGAKTALILPDIATCPDCLREILDPADRRYRYPFTNCTNCGPRFSIMESLPYDRERTSMRAFNMCPDCRKEYGDPANRRFHAQPNACPECGPRLELWDADGKPLVSRDDALLAASSHLREGRIVAVKGLGGFHLFADARNEDAVALLRRRKGREEKPLALMVPSVAVARDLCVVFPLEERLLLAPEAPIVIMSRRPGSAVALSVSPGNPSLGVMLPYTPLHHLLMEGLGFPVVATSGNISEEPIVTEGREALVRLHGIADVFLVHDRPIVRHVDDSVVRIVLDRELVLRRSRGYAPLPVDVGPMLSSASKPSSPQSASALTSGKPCLPPAVAVGAHLKNTVAVTVGSNVFISQHIGDLENPAALAAFHDAIAALTEMYGVEPELVASDLHPDYASTSWARATGLPVVGVQHHYAHVLACMAENGLQAPVLGVAWDGTGYGPDGTVWGGEFLRVDDTGYRRAGRLRRFRLPGGDAAIREPRRSAIGILHAMFGDKLFEMKDLMPVSDFSGGELGILRTMLARGINAPLTSSAGRLFDAVAAITGGRQANRYEGQAAMELEYAALGDAEAYPFPLVSEDGEIVADWGPAVERVIANVRTGVPVGRIAMAFHAGLANLIAAMAVRTGEKRVALTGGCFQNRLLTELAVRALTAAGCAPYWHQRVPPNDGGIALGQAVAAMRTAPGLAA